MRRLAPAFSLALAACHIAAPPPPSQYSVLAPAAPLALAFAPGSAALSPGEVVALRTLAAHIPATETADFTVAGEPAESRAQAVARVLQRNLRVLYQPSLATDEAVLTVPPRRAMTADACRGRAGRLTQDFWPGDDDRGALLLPPGCATEAIIAAQTTTPTDLVAGRPLPPGAALPYAQAIERYYRRNDSAGGKASAEAPEGGGGEGVSSAGSASAATGAGANPLLGGVPPAAGH